MPVMDTIRAHMNYVTQSLRFGVEGWVSQESADVQSGFARRRIQPDEAVVRTSEGLFVEVPIAAEEGRSRELMQQGHDGFVQHSKIANINADLAGADAPPGELNALIFGNALVENVQTA